MTTTVPSEDGWRETPSRIRNTSAKDEVELQALLMFANAMSGGTAEDVIYAQEAAGQRQLVNSDRLPVQSSNPDADFEALGVVFGEPDARDPLFRPATLPTGWKREGTGHSMHSNVVDQYGRKRISVFYKAAFYDRRADMRLVTPIGYLRQLVWDDAGDPILDYTWLTRAVAVEALTELERSVMAEAIAADAYANDSGNLRSDPDYWTGRAAEQRAEAAKYAAMRERIEAAS